jgi:cytochrome b561
MKAGPSLKSSTTRYGSVAITIHWLTAAVILALFATGLLAAGQADPEAKLALVRCHVPLGTGVLVLTLLRIMWWWVADRHPAPPADQPRWQKFMASAVHIGLYLVILLLASSGIATLVLSGALPAVIGGTALPDLETVLPRLVHGAASKVMLGLLALHIGAAIYHQFNSKDSLVKAVAEVGLAPLETALHRAEAAPTPEEGREMLLANVIDLAIDRRRWASAIQGDPVMDRVLAEPGPLAELMTRVYSMLLGLEPGPSARIRTAIVSAAVAGAISHPLVVDLDDATVRAEMLRLLRHLLELDRGL